MRDQDRSGRKEKPAGTPEHRPLREDVAAIDKDILRLLLRRHNLLLKMRRKGRIEPSEEKYLRENWQKNVARISRDAELSGRFFSLMQEINFLPRPGDGGAEAAVPGAMRRQAFNLAPPRQPVNIVLDAPVDDLDARAWLYLAAASGQPVTIRHSSLNDGVVDCIKSLDQAGAAIAREGDGIRARANAPMGSPDKVIHVGDSPFNFYLLLAHYLGRPSRAKFTGETSLRLADFSVLRHFLPQMGARLVHVVPKNDGLPARVECSGVVPPGIAFSEDLPEEFGVALLLAAPFYEKPFSVDFKDYAGKEKIFARALPLMDNAGFVYTLDQDAVAIEPSVPVIPEIPKIPVDAAVAAFLLSFSLPLGGLVRLGGSWPAWPTANAFWRILEEIGADFRQEDGIISTHNDANLKKLALDKIPDQLLAQAGSDSLPLLLALAACAALKGGCVILPVDFAANETVGEFLHAAGLGLDESRQIIPAGTPDTPWNAPSALWAMALALAACARPGFAGFQLGNPGVVTEIWPSFWSIYNKLPSPAAMRDQPPEQQPKRGKRIRTDVAAVLPEIREEEGY